MHHPSSRCTARPTPSRRRRGLAALVPALALLLLALAAPAAHAAVDRDKVGHGGPPNMDRELLAFAEQNPGFGGLWYDRYGNAHVYVTDRRNIAPGLAQALAANPDVTVHEGKYDFRDLARWRSRARALLNDPGVVMVDADEASNRVRIGVSREDGFLNRLWAEGQLATLGVPAEAVIVEEVEPIRPLITLRDRFRPVPAGVQIYFSGYVCTLGANAYRGGTFGFITNSHCTNTQGGVESTRYYQHNTSGGAVATEIADPGYFTGSGCPSGRRCRYSDSSFARYDSTSLGEYRKVARTTSYGTSSSGSLTVSSSSPRFTINGTAGYPSSGQYLDKIGRTSGWTYGQVIATCTDVNVSGTNITQLCQDRVQAYSAGGDSGSPVFSWSGSGSNVTLYGLLWGGNSTSFVMSALDNIEYELGSLTIY